MLAKPRVLNGYSTPDAPIRIGVIGYGYWGPNLVRNFVNSGSARVLIVSDLDPARLAASKRLHSEIETTSDFRSLILDPRIDAVAIATPVHTHYDLAFTALSAGKHVLVEKPLTHSSDQAFRLVEEAAKRHLVLMVDHTFLYTAAVQKIRELLQEGTLGDPYYYDSIRSSLGLFQSDVNVIWDLAVHDLSIIMYILAEEPTAVSATGSSHVAGAPENMAHITLFFQSSCVAHVSVNWLSPIKIRQTFIGGSRRMIVYDDVEPTEKLKVYDKGITLHNTPEKAQQLRIGYRAGDMWAPHIPATEALQAEVEHFIDCIRNQKLPISSGASGLKVVRVLEAASRSIREQGKPIRLEPTGLNPTALEHAHRPKLTG